jgi:hypothetical protein
MRILTLLFTIGLFLALGLAELCIPAMAGPDRAAITKVDEILDLSIQDLGLLPAPGSSGASTPATVAIESRSQPIPELPTWTMMLIFFMGLGLAVFKRGRKDRLSPGID